MTKILGTLKDYSLGILIILGTAIVGVVATAAVVGFIFGGVFVFGWVEQLYVAFAPSLLQEIVAICATVVLAVLIFGIIGAKVIDFIGDEIRAFRVQRSNRH